MSTEHIALPEPKKAFATTEFWVSVITSVLLLLKLYTGQDNTGVDVEALATVAVGIVSAGYAISRALVKRGVVIAQAQIVGTRLSIRHDEESQRIARANEVGKVAEKYAGELQAVYQELEQNRELIKQLVPRTAKGVIDSRSKAGKLALAAGLE